jgi:hypothetical protein
MDTLFSGVNWLHVLVAALAYFALGAVWYSFLFQKSWIRHQNIDMNDPNGKKGVGGIMATSFILMLLATIGLAILIARIHPNGGVVSGLKIGALTGICFSATAISITYLYVKKHPALHAIDGLYHIVGQMIAAVILCAWA